MTAPFSDRPRLVPVPTIDFIVPDNRHTQVYATALAATGLLTLLDGAKVLPGCTLRLKQANVVTNTLRIRGKDFRGGNAIEDISLTNANAKQTRTAWSTITSIEVIAFGGASGAIEFGVGRSGAAMGFGIGDWYNPNLTSYLLGDLLAGAGTWVSAVTVPAPVTQAGATFDPEYDVLYMPNPTALGTHTAAIHKLLWSDVKVVP